LSHSFAGIRSPEQRRAWREKMGLFTIILVLMTGVGFLTFGFTVSVCGKPPLRFHSGSIQKGSVIIHGQDYDFSNFEHPQAGTSFNGKTNPLFEGGWNVAGNDASFLFQKVNQNCLGLITKSSSSSITGAGNTLDWYFPCNVYNQIGTSGVNLTAYEASTNCHITSTARKDVSRLHPKGQVFYTWDDVSNPSRNLAVFEE
jgi:chitin synthase